MIKKIKSILNRIKLTKRSENIIVISFFVIALLFAFAFNGIYKESQLEDYSNKMKLAFEIECQKIISKNEALFTDINAMAYEISKNGSDSNFAELVELYKTDFSICDYVGILKNGVLIKDYFPNGDFSLEESELELSFYKLAEYTNSYNEDVSYFVDTNNNVCTITQKPIYFMNEGEMQYYGELIYRINFTELTKNVFDLTPYGFNRNLFWKLSTKFSFGTILEIYSYNGSLINDPLVLSTHDNYNTEYLFTISKGTVLNSNTDGFYRINLFIIIIVFLSVGLKILFTIIRKQNDMDLINDTKLDFFTNIVYEVRTSTNSIVGFCNEAEKEQLSQNAKGYLNSSKNELKKLLHKINNILDITNITEGKKSSYEEEYYLHMLVQEIADEYKNEIEDRDIKFMLDISDNLPIKLCGSKIIIKKTLSHLIESTLSGIIDGHIKISISGAYLNQTKKNIKLKIVVSDTGIGIKDDYMKDIFILDNIKNSSSDDSKIEIAIASELIKTIGGSLKINSEYGKGTICTIEVSQKVVDDRTMTEEMLAGLKEKYRKNLGKLKKVHANVLIVDDNDVNLSVLRNIIKTYGAEVDSAKSGAIACELASVVNYDMVFIDYLMPELDGYETLKRIRNINKRYRTIPAVLVSANTFNKESDFKDAGFDDYLQKPIVQRDIERCLKSLLSIELIECETPEF